jgi:hypothetical protein
MLNQDFLARHTDNTLGQLGLGDASIPYDSESQLHIFPAPRQVPLDQLARESNDADAVASFAIGIDHAVLLLHNPEGQSPGSVFSTGSEYILLRYPVCGTSEQMHILFACIAPVNGDGQLGRTADKFGYSSTFGEVKIPHSPAPLHLAAGGDTSAAWGPSTLFVWGNTEYGQALVDGEDQLSVPTDVTESVRRSLGDSTIKDVKIAGSALFLLDCEFSLQLENNPVDSKM